MGLGLKGPDGEGAARPGGRRVQRGRVRGTWKGRRTGQPGPALGKLKCGVRG